MQNQVTSLCTRRMVWPKGTYDSCLLAQQTNTKAILASGAANPPGELHANYFAIQHHLTDLIYTDEMDEQILDSDGYLFDWNSWFWNF